VPGLVSSAKTSLVQLPVLVLVRPSSRDILHQYIGWGQHRQTPARRSGWCLRLPVLKCVSQSD